MNKPSPRGVIFALLLSALIFEPSRPAASLSNKRQEAVRPQKPLQHEVVVTLKLIQVVVLDKKGNPVTDLRKEDFVLYDNGRPMSLTEFERHALKIPSGEEPPAEERIAPTPLPGKSALLSRKIFFIFDFAYSDGRGIRTAKEEALKYLDRSLLPSDEVAVLTYSMWGRLKVREFLTTDHAKVRREVEKIGLADAAGAVETPEERYMRAIAESRSRTPKDPPKDPISDYGHHARIYIAQMTSLAQALRYTPGQKTFILFTLGIGGSFLYRISMGDQHAEIRKAYENLCSELATSNIAVYPIDTTDKAAPDYNLPESLRGVSSLRRMAHVTGGEFMGHVDTSKAHFQKIQTLTGAYYVLGYPVNETWDGKYHKIKVEVNRPGLEVRAPAGYLNPKPFSAFTKIERELHLVDLALSDKPFGQVPLRFSMAPLITGLGQDGCICLVARLPLREMREKWTGGPVEILGLVYGRNDEVVAMTRSEQKPAAIREDAAFLAAWADVPPGIYRCRIVVRDLETGAAAVGSSTVAVPESTSELNLLPPLFLRPERGARYVSQGAPRGAAKNAGSEALAAAFAFDPAQYAPYLETKLGKGTEVWVVVPCAGPEGFAEDIKLSARLLDKLTGDEIPLSLTVIAKVERKCVGVFFVRLDIPQVEPDEYRLLLKAEGKEGALSVLAKDVIIE